jgi:hypothetical protein
MIIMIKISLSAAIVSVLLNHGAATNIVNRRREVPHQCAQSRKVNSLFITPRIPSLPYITLEYLHYLTFP